MQDKIWGPAGIIACPACRTVNFEIPTSEDETVITCRCGTILGTMSSLRTLTHREKCGRTNAKLVKAGEPRSLHAQTPWRV
jgi:hypothetical protein